MPDEVDLDELAGLAAALTGRADAAARLVARTMSTRAARRATDAAALRNLLVQEHLRHPPGDLPPVDDLPGELGAVAERLDRLGAPDRAAVVLVRLSDLTLGEVAGILDQSPTALRERLAAVETTLAADPLAVRATLETLSWRVPDPPALQAARYRAEQAARLRRGQTRLVAVAAGLAVLVALAVPTVRMFWPVPARALGDWSYGLEVALPEGWRQGGHVVTRDQEFLSLWNDETQCSMVASLPSAPSDRRLEVPDRTERVWVDGRPLRFTTAYEDSGAALWWPYGRGGEVGLTCNGLVDQRATLVELAGHLRFAPGRRIVLPFALDRAPAPYETAGAGSETDDIAMMLLSKSPNLAESDSAIYVFTTTEQPGTSSRLTRNGVDYLLGREGWVQLCREITPTLVCVGVPSEDPEQEERDPKAGEQAVDLALDVMEGLRFAPDLRDRSTWFDARDALPR